MNALLARYLLMGGVFAILIAALFITRGTLAEVKAERDAIQSNFHQFQADVKAQTAKAEVEDLRNVVAVKGQQESLNVEVVNAYEAKLADLGKRYNALRMQSSEARTNSGGSDSKSVPKPVAGSGCLVGPAEEDGFLGILRDAEENTVKLIELQDAVKRQAGIK